MNTDDIEHDWAREQMAACLTGGLTEAEMLRFNGHLAACARCAAELQTLQQQDQSMQAVFASAVPGVEFESRIILGLRQRWHRRLVIHPMVRRAVAGVAAAALLGAIGYVASAVQNGGGLPRIIAAQRSGDGWAASPFTLDISGGQGQGAPVAVTSNEQRFASFATPAADEWRRDKTRLPEGDEGAMTASRLNSELDALPSNTESPSSRKQSDAAKETGAAHYYADSPAAPVLGDSFKPASLAAVPDGGTLLLGGATVTGEVVREAGVASSSLESVNGPRVLYGDARVQWDRTGAKAPESGAAGGGAKLEVAMSPVAGVTPEVTKAPVAVVAPDSAAKAPPAPPAGSAPATEAALQRKIIRTGQMEFEVDSFDSASAQVEKIVAEERGFVASAESEKLANGKMRGSIVLRVAPERLDTLVLKLRALGELKNQKVVASDITKQYTDLESQLRAARAMEQRLLEIIKTGKGEIKDLVAAERELGVWREKIEKTEGEIRYYANQVALSTLTITLAEKDVKAAASASETELRSIGVETEDVEAAYASAQELVAEFKGRVVGATLRKLDAGQFAANVVCDVAPESAGPMTDRLKQLGKVARLEAERKQTAASGGEIPATAKVQRKETRFVISLYNLANIAPRETTTVNLACSDVEGAYRAIVLGVAKTGGRIVSSNLNQLKAGPTTATIAFQVKSDDAESLLALVRKPGGAADTEVTRLSSTENTDTANVTAAKRGFVVQIVSLTSIAPRETISLQVAASSVRDAYQSLVSLLGSESTQARVLSAQLAQEDRQNTSGTLDVELRRSQLAAFEKALASTGDIVARSTTRATEGEHTSDAKVRMVMTLVSAENMPPREVTTLTLEARDVEKAMGELLATAATVQGRTIESRLVKEPGGRVSSHLVVEVPAAKAADVLSAARQQGTVRAIDSSRNMLAPAGSLARTRLDITLGSGDAIVGDQGIWSTIRGGLSTSVAGLLWSLQLIVIGLFLVGPWLAVSWLVWKVARRGRARGLEPRNS
jgi:anti-sigma factor RsiW